MAIHSSSTTPATIHPVSRPSLPEDEERAEDVYDIPLGAIVHDSETGRQWVFFGWASNTAGRYPNFIEEMEPGNSPHAPRYDYHAAFTRTLERKFPALSRFRRTAIQDSLP